MLYSVVALIQQKNFFSSAPKVVLENIQPKEERFRGGACAGICIAGSGGPVHGCFFRGRRCGRGPEQLFVFSVSHPLPSDVSAAEGIRHRVFRLGAALPFAFLSILLPGARRSAGAGAFRIQQEESYPSDFLLRRVGQYHRLLVLGISELSWLC